MSVAISQFPAGAAVWFGGRRLRPSWQDALSAETMEGLKSWGAVRARRLTPGDRIVVETPGGGGFGVPAP